MDIASLGIRIDSTQAKTAANDLDRLTVAGGKAEKSAGGIASAFKGLGGAFAGISLGLIAQQVVRAGDAYNNLNARLSLVTQSTRDFVSAQRELFSIAQATGTGLEQTTDLFGSLARSTESLGVSQEKVLGVTKTINQALAVSGTSAQGAAAALVQLGQGFASGVLRGEELNSVLEQAPRLARAIADGLGVPIGQLRKLGEEGQLTGERVFEALQKSGAAINAEYSKLPLTVGRASTQAENSLLKLIGTLDTATGATTGLAGLISGAAGAFSGLADQIDRVRQGNESAGFLGALAETIQNAIEAVQVFGANVSFVLKATGREIGAIAAQVVALAKLDISGFNAISEAVKEDARRARAELDAFERRVLSRSAIPEIGQNDRRELARRGRAQPAFGAAVENPLTPKGPKPRKDNTAEQEARAQLTADIDAIKRAQEALTNTIANGDKIVEAQRAANLLSESEYYAKKREFIQVNDAIEESALEREIARLQAEALSGKDKIDNDRKIADAQGRLAKVREDSANAITVLGIQESASLKKTAQGFIEARIAAEAYLEALQRSQRIELEGIGRGSGQRDFDAARNQITERYEAQRQSLEGERRRGEIDPERYRAELALIDEFQSRALSSYEDYYGALKDKQADFNNGIGESLANYLTAAADLAKQTEDATTRALSGIEDAFVSLATTGKADFKSLANSIIADIIRIQARAAIAGIISGFSVGGGAATNNTGANLPTSGGRASGGPVGAGKMYRVNENGPELLNVAGKQYLMMGGESGSVSPSGASGGGSSAAPQFNLQIHNAPAGATVNRRQNASGGMDVDVIFEQFRDKLIGEVQQGGKFDNAMQGQYGVNRAQGLVR